MRLALVRHLWGVDEPMEQCLPRFVQQGYGAIETGLPAPEGVQPLSELLERNGLGLIPQVFLPAEAGDASVDRQVEALGQAVRRAGELGPILVNCHGGFDGWSLEQAVRFYRQAAAIQAEAGIEIAHETHRGRYFFHPGNAMAVLREVPELKLCVDYSHWVCVCERLIDDQADALALTAQRAIHVHARVGYEEGPQVPDPRVEAYRKHVEAHERWWDAVWSAQSAAGRQVSTLTPEFGPPPYLQTDPRTGQPLADLEEVCNWMARRLADRFARRFG